MSKYIIELDDRIKLVTSVGVTENGVVYTTSDYVHNLEELNSDYINENFGELHDEAYQRGLEDAWEAAKKLFSSMADSDIEKAFPIEWNNGGFKALMNLQPQEAIAKLKAYEDKHPDSIEVGDEVEWEGEKFTILRVFTPKGCYEQCDGFDDAGNGYTNILTKDVKKTGKHYDIASILEAMRT